MTLAPPPAQFWKNGVPPVAFYEGPDYMYSNFASFAVDLYGRVWPTAEHAYQSMKFIDGAMKTAIFEARSAHEAKKVARRNEALLRPGWDGMKLAVMEEILRAKLRQHPYIREKLLQTGTRIIIENSPKDAFWGRGPDWRGFNHLGKIWMRLRGELRDGTFA